MPHRLVLLIATLATALGLLLPVSALADPRYEVMNAPEGVFWRSEPNWAAAERISGFGVYNGTIIEVHCYQSGTAVEGSADTMWEQATDVGGRGYGSGWVNEHFINDGQPINQPSPGVGPCNPPPPPHEETPPPPVEEHASGGLIFPIFNAEGGIYYRNSPHWPDTSATPGVGVYNGDQVRLICGALGDPVGPFSDTAWSYVNNLSREVGDGWVNEHFVNDGQLANQFVPGEPMCGPGTPGLSGSSPPTEHGPEPIGAQPPPPTEIHLASGPQSIFYWPPLKLSEYPPHVPHGTQVGDLTFDSGQWIQGGCTTTKAAKLPLPATVNTLAGWSLSRLAPIYVLDTHRSQWQQIHTLIFFDPGSYDEMKNGCEGDPRFHVDINSLLVNWLRGTGNELIVLAGVTSESDHFRGLWHYYFKGVWSQSAWLRHRVVVCNYHGLGHPNVVTDFYQLVKAAGDGARPASCPISPHAHLPTPWNP